MKTKLFSLALLASSFVFAQTIPSSLTLEKLTVNSSEGVGSNQLLLQTFHVRNPDRYFMKNVVSGFGTDDVTFFLKHDGQMYVDGNVGVGTMNPQAKFDVAGGINIAGGFPIQLVGNVSAHGLKYKRNNSDNSLLDGPFLYGWSGGGLGIKKDNNEFNVLSWNESGNVAIQGKLEAKEVKVTLTPTADFVFDENYNLPKLEAIEKHIKEKKHLPEIASAKEMEKEGVNVGEFQIKLLQKIEELTLYTIELNKQVKKQAEEIEVLKKKKNKL